jgi:hypothetical protein
MAGAGSNSDHKLKIFPPSPRGQREIPHKEGFFVNLKIKYNFSSIQGSEVRVEGRRNRRAHKKTCGPACRQGESIQPFTFEVHKIIQWLFNNNSGRSANGFCKMHNRKFCGLIKFVR